jgi:hypothetical protein
MLKSGVESVSACEHFEFCVKEVDWDYSLGIYSGDRFRPLPGRVDSFKAPHQKLTVKCINRRSRPEPA